MSTVDSRIFPSGPMQRYAKAFAEDVTQDCDKVSRGVCIHASGTLNELYFEY